MWRLAFVRLQRRSCNRPRAKSVHRRGVVSVHASPCSRLGPPRTACYCGKLAGIAEFLRGDCIVAGGSPALISRRRPRRRVKCDLCAPEPQRQMFQAPSRTATLTFWRGPWLGLCSALSLALSEHWCAPPIHVGTLFATRFSSCALPRPSLASIA